MSPRSTNIIFIDNLFDIQEALFQYLLRCLELLNTHELVGLTLSIHQLIPVSIQALKARTDLILKYAQQVKILSSFDEVEKIYMTIYDFVSKDLDILEASFKSKAKNFPIVASTALSTDDANLLSHFVNYLFPENQIVRVIQFIRHSPDKIDQVRNDQALAATYNVTIILEAHGELIFDTDIDVTKKDLESYNGLYRNRRTSSIHAMLFKLSILKELAFSPKLNEAYELKYENSILRSILDNELDNSPKTFNDDQQAVLDVMEILSFHVDTIPRVTDLIYQFCEIATLKKLTAIVRETGRPAEADFYRRTSAEMQSFLKSTAADLRGRLISAGTFGLSLRASYKEVLKLLSFFLAHLDILLGADIIPRNPKFFYKDEFHFLSTLKEYDSALYGLLTVTYRREPGDIKTEFFDEFEDADGDVKDVFFKMNHFSQRFKYEKEIAKVAKGGII